jgi:hypothetical protein
MSWTAPTVAQFKAQFYRDFPYAPATDLQNLDYVIDQDITNAITEALQNFNCALFGDNTTIIFLYLAAHTLVSNIRNSSMGLSSQAKFPLESSSVGGVSIANNINERFASDPIFAGYLTTGYGKKYLDLVYPYTIGNVGISCGITTPA